MADLKIADAPELAIIEGDEKIPTGNSGGNFSIVTDALAQFVKDSKDLQSGAEVDATIAPVEMEVATHVADLVNPHQVTKAQVGLANVDNTADVDKPISNAVQSAITTLTTNKADKTYVDSQLSTKADKLTTYTKTEVDSALSLKANQSTTYTKVEVDTKLSDKQEKLSVDGILTGTNSFSNVPNLDGLDGNPSSVMNQQAQALMNRTENLRYLTKTGLNYFDSAYASSIGGYPNDTRLILSDGINVQSKINNNLIDPNANMDDWYYVGMPQVESIANMRLLNPTAKGGRVYLASWHEGLNLGGGVFVATQNGSLVDNGGTIIATQNPLIFYVRINYDSVTPLMFGAKGDGVNDDRPAFQNAVDFLRSSGGGELLIPKPATRYSWKSYDATDSACLVINVPLEGTFGNPISLRGLANDTRIFVDLGLGTTIEAAILLKGGGSYKKFENITVWGGVSTGAINCNYVLKGLDFYYPDFTMRNAQFYGANIACVRLASFVAQFDQLRTAFAPKGTYITGAITNTGGEVTALTFNSCYGLNHTDSAFHLGQATYCSFNACAADHIDDYAYKIDIARGVSFNGCGVESSMRIMKVITCQGLTINGLMTLNIGDATIPPADLIRIDGGASMVISGLWNQNKRGAQYILSLGSAFSTESVTVLDQSLEPADVNAPSNFRFQNPVRFLLRDFSRKTQDTTLTNTGNATTNTTNLQNALNAAHSTELIHDVIVRFPSGDFPIDGVVNMSNSLTRGGARIRLIGNADNTSRIVASGNGAIYFGSTSVIQDLNYQVENLNLHISTVTAPNKGFHFYKGTTTFINSKITSDNTFRQYAAENSPVIRLDANSSIQTNYFGFHTIQYTYKATAAPTSSTRLPAGTIFMASDPNSTRVGWINTTDNGATWLALNPS